MDSIEQITKYFPDISEAQKRSFGDMPALYSDWNEKINVISRKDIDHLVERHILHSLAIAKAIRFEPGTRIIDIGTGGGFPTIPLAVLMPDVQFTAVDRIGKKIKVVEAISAELGLRNVFPKHSGAEQMKQSFDFVISRAVTNLPDFLPLTKNLITKKMRNAFPNGIWYLKGGDFAEELRLIKHHYEVFEISKWYDEPFFETKKLVYINAG